VWQNPHSDSVGANGVECEIIGTALKKWRPSFESATVMHAVFPLFRVLIIIQTAIDWVAAI